MEISKSLIILLLMLAAVLAIPATGYFYIIPVYNEIKYLNAQKIENEETLRSKLELVDNIKNSKMEFNSVDSAKKKKVFYILPSSSEFPNLIVQLEALAIENGIFFEDIVFEGKKAGNSESNNVKNTKKTISYNSGREKLDNGKETSENISNIEEILIDVKVSGKYESFMSYLNAIEENVRILDIDSIEFSSSCDEIISEKEIEKAAAEKAAEEGKEGEEEIIKIEELTSEDFNMFSFNIKMKTYWLE